MSDEVTRTFPLIHSQHVRTVASFYELLGFEVVKSHPDLAEPWYTALRRGSAELCISAIMGDTEQATPSSTIELFVFVDDVDRTVSRMRESGAIVLGEPQDMPWGERVARLVDPDGNQVAIAAIS